MFSLQNKIALITGAGSGIGAAIAETFARAEAFVFVSDRDEKTGKETAARIKAQGGRAEFIGLDVTKEAQCENAKQIVVASKGRLDVLVNNAGIGHVGTMLQTSGADLDRLYGVNVRGVFNLTKAFLPAMLARQQGVIINLASIGGVVGIRDRLAYCATKFAVVGLTKSMALDHAADGIRVNCICPGRVETPFVSARLKEYPDPQKAYLEMAATQALGRMGKPEEIAAAALYLASDEAAFITGTAFLIDGGWSAGK
ncbi:MAG TPA: SDR family oxidoreductase [Candidatus Eisenbacteria bacterium]|jgi:NAD(P)-dependent dehydrogenase (short-subunit alcohol dehydrogenase family)|nr:SDR family oxidoreductase [Candidatus Eisenbacteria bacterium]